MDFFAEVLILIVVEDGLVHDKLYANPSRFVCVLILIVVEDGLVLLISLSLSL